MSKTSWMALWLATLIAGWQATPARAFTIRTGVTDACHEQITAAAYAQAAVRLPEVDQSAAPDGEWEEIARYLLGDHAPETRAERFMLFSLLVGTRAPDGEGHSLLNISSLRAIQADPDGQYAHCLRHADDNGHAGNAAAVEGCTASIVDDLRKAATFDPGGPEPAGRLLEVTFSLDSYGTFEVEVLATPYYLGRALHTLADSFSHTLRTPDLRSIVHVMNYEAAVRGELVEHRDGMAHSDAADSCVLVSEESGDLVNRDRVFAAVEGSADMIRAFTRYLELRRQDPTQEDKAEAEFRAVLAKWMRLANPGDLGDFDECDQDNDYCESQWLELARLEPSEPFLPCTVAVPGRRDVPDQPGITVLFGCALLLVARQRPGRRR